MQLLQFSPDNQLIGGGLIPSGKVQWQTRWGAYAKVGYDFCSSRWGIELPFSYNRQKLNRSETVHMIGIDANAVFHIVETQKGADFYWIAGTGVNLVTEGSINNNTGNAGINLNFGPGFQYFINKSPKVALGVSLPFKYTLYLGDHLSRNNTQVFGFPVQVGFTIGF
ncbi:MAG: hypothetical protein A3I70_00865 [Deltaproteobacteria bacterium RIFCSPLOWO2_02_FULL_44_34]|nr:MAG: hypothetical protein A3I70_00865 [Deltaproteobacteria bacterium RIFCSPLOWO2_02_FULL_44_34]